MSTTIEENRLTISKTFQASRQRVFDAWTKPENIKQWFGCSDSTVAAADLDLTPGGRFRYQFANKKHGDMAVNGTFTVVNPPEELGFTWKWEGEGDFAKLPETRVQITFKEQGDATLMELTHEGFPNGEIRDAHNGGWGDSLEKLEKFLAQ